jgi:hypothetical protein
MLAGLGLTLMALLAPGGINVAIPSAIPVFWLCLWLIINHIDRAADPVLLRYVYHLFALAALLLALYYIAGHAFRQSHPPRLMFSASVATYFTAITMGDGLPRYSRGILLSLAVTVLIYQLTLTKNLARPLPEYRARDTDTLYSEGPDE